MLNSRTKPFRFILASGSPRRQQFFKDMQLDVVIELKPIEEVFPPNDVLITSDTLVWHEGKAIGKPNSAEEAVDMLLSLSNATHEVITSVTFTTINGQHTLNDVTAVSFGPLTESEIKHYIAHFEPFDKAGSYGIQDWIGLVGVQRIVGSYTNVMGLPVEKVYRYIVEHFTTTTHVH